MRKPIARNLTYAIVEQLGQAIVTGTYSKTNTFPIEAELCKQFGASRSVLREAVKMLTAKGLLSARPRQGTWVEAEDQWNLLDPDVLRWLLDRKFSLSLLADFTEVRLAIEPMSAWIAAQSHTPETLAPIQDAIRRMEAAAQGDDDPLASDIAFHVAVLRASRNRFFSQLEELIGSALRISIRLTNQVKGVPLADVDLHRQIFDAIRQGDGARARSMMESMLLEVMQLIARAGGKSRAERAAGSAALHVSKKSA